jgi:hypothetical protein
MVPYKIVAAPSGDAWVEVRVSKVLGGIMLKEHMHPHVCIPMCAPSGDAWVEGR